MAPESITEPTARRHVGTLDRRDFGVRAVTVGLAMGLIDGAPQASEASSNNATPTAGGTADPTAPAGGYDMASASEHYALADGEAEAIWFLGTLALIRGVDSRTGDALATVEFLHPSGFATPLHVHHTADEAFYVLAGGMRGVCGDREWRATTGSFVWLPRGVPHGYAVDGDEPLRTLAIALPAGFDRFVVEAGEPARERTLPPPAAPDVEKLEAVGTKYGIENVGPPVQFRDTLTA